MSTNKTPNYQLSQWITTDPVRMSDFNADHSKIDAALADHETQLTQHTAAIAKCGNCKIWTTSYVGTGTAGSSKPCTLVFPAKPIFIRIASSRGAEYANDFYGSEYIVMRTSNGAAFCKATWGETTVSWYDTTGAGNQINQLNEKNTLYYVMALLDATE